MVKIISFQAEDDEAPGSVALARFTVAIGEIQLRSILLRRNDVGGYRIQPPTAFRKYAFAVEPRLWSEIELSAIRRYEAIGVGSVHADKNCPDPGSVAIDLG